MVGPAPVRRLRARALLVTYEGRRLGAWWAAGWASGLEEVASARDPGLIAEWIRWARLPALEPRSLPEVRRLAERWPAEALRAWSVEDSSDGWRFVARAAFRDWWPGPDQLDGVAGVLGGAAPIPEVAAALRLMDLCPVTMGRFLKARAEGASDPERRVLFAGVRRSIEDSLRFDVGEWVGTDDTLRDGVSRATGLADAFLRGLNASGMAAVLGHPPGDEFDQRPNLDLAVTQFTACRLLLAMDILQCLEAGAVSHWKGGHFATA